MTPSTKIKKHLMKAYFDSVQDKISIKVSVDTTCVVFSKGYNYLENGSTKLLIKWESI